VELYASARIEFRENFVFGLSPLFPSNRPIAQLMPASLYLSPVPFRWVMRCRNVSWMVVACGGRLAGTPNPAVPVSRWWRVVTQFMSDSATTALFTPIAIALAQALGHAPEPFVVTVAMASVVAFSYAHRPSRRPSGLWPRALQFHGLCESRHTLNGDLCADCRAARATVLARVIEPQENRSTKACTYQVRSTCHLTNSGSGTKIWTLTKMDGTLYSLAPNHLVLSGRRVNTEALYS